MKGPRFYSETSRNGNILFLYVEINYVLITSEEYKKSIHLSKIVDDVTQSPMLILNRSLVVQASNMTNDLD